MHHHLGRGWLSAERQRQRHLVALHAEIADQAEGHDVLLTVGVLDATERVEDSLLARHTTCTIPDRPGGREWERHFPILVVVQLCARARRRRKPLKTRRRARGTRLAQDRGGRLVRVEPRSMFDALPPARAGLPGLALA